MQVLNNNYVSYVDITTCVFSILLLFLLFFSYNKKDYQYQILCGANICILIAGITSIIYNLTLMNIPIETKKIELLIYTMHHLSNIAMICVWVLILLYLYTIIFYNKIEKTRKRTTIICCGLMLIYEIIEGISPITNFGLCIKNGIAYEHFFWNPFTIFYLLYAISFLICFIIYRKIFPKKTFSYICILTIYVFLIMIVGAILETTTYNVLTFFIPIIFIYIMFHGEKFNVESGALGPEAFYSFIQSSIKKKETFFIVSLFISQKDGVEIETSSFNNIALVFNSYFNKGTLFRKGKNILNVITKEEYNEDIEQKLNLCMEQITKHYVFNNLKLIVLKYNKNILGFKTAKEIIEFNKFLISKAPSNKIYKQTEDDYKTFNQMNYIKNELLDINYKKDMNDERILVFCQPILNSSKTYKNAEMLMRLNLPKIGLIYPNDFIPLAENFNLIHTLSLIILNKTCLKIKDLLNDGYEINRFSINFSAKEFNNETFYDEIINIIDNIGIPYNKLAFEITESSFNQIENLIEIMNKLKEKGIVFYLDDFGTGYSNIDRIAELPFSTIKFDRSLVLSSMKKDSSKFIVKNLCNIFNAMKYEILFEGIETDKDEDMCKSMGANYFQGYKYSKPIPIDEIKDYLQKEK